MNSIRNQIVPQIFLVLVVFSAGVFAQIAPPEPSAPKSVKVPSVKEATLKNGLKIAVVERPGVPLVSVQLLIKAGASSEDMEKAGLADFTASLLTKGTKTQSATQIAEEMEFLGAELNSGAGWNSSSVSMNVMSDKLEKAFEIMADSVLNPAFSQAEIDLYKSQALDGLKYNLTQPGFLTSYVASVYSYREHPATGTPESLEALNREDIVGFHKDHFLPVNAILIFVGDVTLKSATDLGDKHFSKWEMPKKEELLRRIGVITKTGAGAKVQEPVINRIMVIDLPDSGQASVSFAKRLKNGRVACGPENGTWTCEPRQTYFPAIALNSLLGGGYSSRLNQEIRIKRGLSYGAGSSFAWRDWDANFGTRTQTKNESAAEVAELVVDEIKKLSEVEISEAELNPRRLVLTGGFGRNLETNQGLANAIADLYSFQLPAETLNSYMDSVMTVDDKQIKTFAKDNFTGGDMIIVGDYSVFKDDLAKRFPNMKVDVIKADELDVSKSNLRK